MPERRASGILTPMDADSVHAFLLRDRSATEDLKRRHWAERFRAEGSAATLAASSALREHAKRVRPDWPTDAERADDLAHHVALRRKLDRAARALGAR